MHGLDHHQHVGWLSTAQQGRIWEKPISLQRLLRVCNKRHHYVCMNTIHAILASCILHVGHTLLKSMACLHLFKACTALPMPKCTHLPTPPVAPATKTFVPHNALAYVLWKDVRASCAVLAEDEDDADVLLLPLELS